MLSYVFHCSLNYIVNTDYAITDLNVRYVIRSFVLIRFKLNAIKLITVHLKGSLKHHADHKTGW